jgi:GxxExxY protein
LESVYEQALMIELRSMSISARNQVEIPVYYRGQCLGMGFRADIVVEESLLLELKAIEAVSPAHLAITINYLKLLKFKRGFILNFNTKLLKDGIKRVSI